jgi:hypothetical protein
MLSKKDFWSRSKERSFQKPARIEKIDSSILDFGF